MKEIWKTIPGWEGKYEISDLGRVKSLSRKIRKPAYTTKSGARRGAHWFNLPERILRPAIASHGYLTVSFGRENSKKIQALLMLAFVGAPKPGQIVRHLNDIRTDNRLENLAYGTRSQNRMDAVRNGKCRIPKSVVDEIKKTKTGYAALSRKLKVSKSYIHAVRKGKLRAHGW